MQCLCFAFHDFLSLVFRLSLFSSLSSVKNIFYKASIFLIFHAYSVLNDDNNKKQV